MRSSAQIMLATPAALRNASSRVLRSSESLAPAAGRCVRARGRFRHPAARPRSSGSLRIKVTRRDAGSARGGD
eukprot:8572048-Alexandrium_andersonii.AAC.1